jgi:RNA polymerase sigma factor for flagellar operon FliA
MEELQYAMKDVSVTTLVSLDELICREDDNRQVPRIETIENSTTVDVLDDMEKTELRVFLIHAISGLSEQERLVISLYYYETTLKEIGRSC